ncbi:MAG: hypothetical protein GC145_08645 [Caulobacter sp.]|nr:hypothetical protein [Caulobacter sp.]
MIALVTAALRRLTAPLIVLLLVLLLALMFWAGFAGLGARRREITAARSEAEVAMSRAGSKAAGAASEAVAAMAEREADRKVRELETRDEILATPDAKTSAGAAGHAGLVGLCRRALYRDHPRCAGLRRTDSAAAAR